MDGEFDFAAPLVERFTAYHRRSYICKAGLGDVLIGAAATVADYNGAAKAGTKYVLLALPSSPSARPRARL